MMQCTIALNPFKHEMIVHIQIECDHMVLHTFNKLGYHIEIEIERLMLNTFEPMETYIKVYFFP
jgi:hypothetical protein